MHLILLILAFGLCSAPVGAELIPRFSTPDGWEVVKPESDSSEVLYLVQGSGNYELPPTVNICMEKLAPDIQRDDYLAIARAIHESHRERRVMELGTVSAKADLALAA